MSVEIQKSTKTVPVYMVGGEEFLSLTAAQDHLNALRARLGFTYFLVDSGFDQTEGRGYFAHRIVAVRHDRDGHAMRMAAIMHCIGVLGAPITEWYGRALALWVVRDGAIFDSVDELVEWLRAQSTPRHGERFAGITYLDVFGRTIEPPEGGDVPEAGMM